MARRLRITEPNGIYHVTARGNRRQVVFEDDRDRRTFLALLRQVVSRRGWTCHSYCLMPNHFHLVVQTPAADLSAGMQALNSRYAERFNRRHGLDGHLFQGRFHAVAVESDWHLLELARYVVLNPVRGGLSGGPADYPWSSYALSSGISPLQAFLASNGCSGTSARTPAPAATRSAHSSTMLGTCQWPRLSRLCLGVRPLDMAHSADAVGAGEAAGEETDEEGCGEADHVEVVTVDALDQ